MSPKEQLATEAICAVLNMCTADERRRVLVAVDVQLAASPAVVIDKAAIERAIVEADGHIGRAACALGIARRTMQNKMRLFGVPPGLPGKRSRPASVV